MLWWARIQNTFSWITVYLLLQKLFAAFPLPVRLFLCNSTRFIRIPLVMHVGTGSWVEPKSVNHFTFERSWWPSRADDRSTYASHPSCRDSMNNAELPTITIDLVGPRFSYILAQKYLNTNHIGSGSFNHQRCPFWNSTRHPFPSSFRDHKAPDIRSARYNFGQDDQ